MAGDPNERTMTAPDRSQGQVEPEGERHGQVLTLPAGDLPPTGREFGGKGVGIFEVRDGRLAAQRIYFEERLSRVRQCSRIIRWLVSRYDAARPRRAP